ncbi:MAG: 5'-3' exonuclease [Metallibacterium sp.]
MDGLNARGKAYLVDASMYVFRAWYAYPADAFRDAEDHPANATHGFVRFLLDFLQHARPARLMLGFDIALGSSFRNLLYPAYKANRAPAPPELLRQFDACRAFAQALGLSVHAHASYEADDLIGSAVVQARALDLDCVIVSADKDFGQLLGTHDEQWDWARETRWGPDGVHQRFGVWPRQISDYLGLCGDAVDNIPGVPGIGARTAARLLTQFGDLDTLLAGNAELAASKTLRGAGLLAQRLREHADAARLCKRLATIACDAPLPDDCLARGRGDGVALDALLQQHRFGPHTRSRAMALIEEPLPT